MTLHYRNKPTQEDVTAEELSHVNIGSIFSAYDSYRTSRDAAATGDNIDCPARNASPSEAEVNL